MPLIPRTAGLAYLAGFIAADGHLESNEPYIVIASSERSFLNDYIALLIQDQIKRKPRPYWGKTAKVWKIRIYSRQLWTVFNREYKVPTGKKAHIVLPPQNLRTPERVWYTRGWFEGEGWLEIMTVHRSSGLYQYPRIGFKVSNQPIRDWILLELNRHGVKAKKYNRRDGTFGLWINGTTACKAFLQKFGFLYPPRNNKLRKLIQTRIGRVKSNKTSESIQ